MDWLVALLACMAFGILPNIFAQTTVVYIKSDDSEGE